MVRERDPDYFLYLSKDGREHTLKKKRWSSLQPPHKEVWSSPQPSKTTKKSSRPVIRGKESSCPLPELLDLLVGLRLLKGARA